MVLNHFMMSLDEFPQSALGTTQKYRRGSPKCISKQLKRAVYETQARFPTWTQNPTFGSKFETFCMVRSVEHHDWVLLSVLDGFKSFYDVPG